MHAYRAALEKLIHSVDVSKRKLGLGSVKNAQNLPFQEYVALALRKHEQLKLACLELLNNDPVTSLKMEKFLANWHQIAVFYTLRLLIAPLIESAILLDRLLYLKENGVEYAEIGALFSAKISPRNLAILATKTE